MKTLSFFAAAMMIAVAMPVPGQSAQTPGSPNNNQIAATNVVSLPTLPSTSGSGGSPTGTTGTPASTGRIQVLCLAAAASVTHPFFTGTDLSCAP